MAADTDEAIPEGLNPSEVSVHIAREKALTIEKKFPGKTIIAADTIVVLNNEIIGKPKDREDAIAILKKLNGAHHQVITGVVIRKNDREIAFHDSTDVQFYRLSIQELTYYVDKYQPFDKAGAYAIQEWIGVVGIKSIQGDFYNVMGLPVSRVVRALREFSPS